MKLLKCFLACLILASCQQNKTEKLDKKMPLTRSKIDSLNTEAAVQQFVREKDTNYKKFELRKIADFRRIYRSRDEDSLVKVLAKKLRANKSFYKADVDNNGFTDLIVIGDNYSCTTFGDDGKSKSCDFSVLALMNFGKDSIRFNDLMDDHHSGLVPQISEVNGLSKITINHTRYIYDKQDKFSGVRTETTLLDYKFNSFLEYEAAAEKHAVEKIEFSASACFGTCPIFKLEVTKGRKAILWAEDYNYSIPHPKNREEFEKRTELKGKYTSVISPEKYDEITDLINYLNINKLQKEYMSPGTDHPDSLLKITYDNGKVKTIDDYGINGTRGLKRLYELLFQLRFNQDWKLVSKELEIKLY